MLKKLQNAKIYIDINKYKFHIIETKFLNIIFDKNKMRINFAKIKLIYK